MDPERRDVLPTGTHCSEENVFEPSMGTGWDRGRSFYSTLPYSDHTASR
jgi:hypothetical protein